MIAWICTISLIFWGAPAGRATSVPGLSFEELTDRSELIVSGHITRSWSDWDAEHKYIWTHHELSVSSAAKGTPGRTVVLSELGGSTGDRSLNVAGAVAYRAGENVMVFLQRMPNGYLRTTGWGQGKYTVDNTGRVHAETASPGLDIVNAQNAAPARTSLTAIEGMNVSELSARVAARLSVQQRQGGIR